MMLASLQMQHHGSCSRTTRTCTQYIPRARSHQGRRVVVRSEAMAGPVDKAAALADMSNKFELCTMTVAGPPGPATRFTMPRPELFEMRRLDYESRLDVRKDMADTITSLQKSISTLRQDIANKAGACQVACEDRDQQINQVKRRLEVEQMAAAAERRRVATIKKEMRHFKALLAQQVEALRLELNRAKAIQMAEDVLLADWAASTAGQRMVAEVAEVAMISGPQTQGTPVDWTKTTVAANSSSSVAVMAGASSQQQEAAAAGDSNGLWRPLEEVTGDAGSFHSSFEVVRMEKFDAFLAQQQHTAVPARLDQLRPFWSCTPLAVSISAAATSSSTSTSSQASSPSSLSSHSSSSHNSSHPQQHQATSSHSSSSTVGQEGGLLAETSEVALVAPDTRNTQLVTALASKRHHLGSLLRSVCKQGVAMARHVPIELQRVAGFVKELCGSAEPAYVLTSHQIDLTDEDEEVVEEAEMVPISSSTPTTTSSSSSMAAGGGAKQPLAATTSSTNSSSSQKLRGGYVSVGSSWDEGDASELQQQQQQQPKLPRSKGSGKRRRIKRSSRHSDRMGRGFGV